MRIILFKKVIICLHTEWDKMGYFRIIGLTWAGDSVVNMCWFYFLGINLGIGIQHD